MLQRPRRLRAGKGIRNLVRETVLHPTDLIYPFFVSHEASIKKEIPSMPGCYHYGLERLEEVVHSVVEAGIAGILLFGIPATKDEIGSGAWNDEGVVQQAVRKIKHLHPELVVITDVCLCEYTSHGHCGMIEGETILNDATLDLLARTAVSHARAGADLVAPSDMMDGRVLAIRRALDGEGFQNTPILSYAAKYASAFYGPFRQAADSAPAFGDRRSYQMDTANCREALREIQLDIEQGADIIMIKPALAYLDVIREARNRFDIPIAAYNVSGEYSMVKAAAEKGWIDEKKVVLEILTSIKRSGADMILTYHALDAARWILERL